MHPKTDTKKIENKKKIVDIKDKINKNKTTILMILFFGLLVIVFLFAFTYYNERSAGDASYEMDNSKITGFATKETVNEPAVKEKKGNYEIRMQYSPDFLLKVNITEVTILKKEILKMRQAIDQCVKNGKVLDDCIIQESKTSNFQLNCNTEADTNLKKTSDAIESCKNAIEESCVCDIDLSNVKNTYYLINLKDIDSVALYDYDAKLSETIEKTEKSILDEETKKSNIVGTTEKSMLTAKTESSNSNKRTIDNYLSKSIVLRNLQMLENDKETVMFTLKNGNSNIMIKGASEHEHPNKNVLIIKQKGSLNIVDNAIAKEQIQSAKLPSCTIQKSKVYNFCTAKEYSFTTSNGIKKTKVDFALDFS